MTVFYSLKGETIAPGMKVVNLEKGHTAAAVKYIQKAVGGDLFEIETIKRWNTMPMSVVGFPGHYDWNGKQIVPFVTSGGSGFGKSIEDMRRICSGAEILDGGAFLGH